ncbi:MAG: sensor domain-containing diguanylate cyclase [Candidatus Limnocylindrales bacterium]
MTDRDRPTTPSDTMLATAIAAAARATDPQRAVAGLVNAAIEAVGADHGAVFLWDGERGALSIAASAGYSADEATAFEAMVAGNADHPVAQAAHGQTAILGAETVGPDGMAQVIATWPLRVTTDGVDEPLGALTIARPAPWPISEMDSALPAALADLIAMTVDRARLVASVTEQSDWQERMAHTDALTGLANSRTLARVLELEIARAGRQGTDLSIALFDVDGLAGTNATLGSAAGDDILRELAATLAESIRLVDTVARWGGDEFIVVAPGSAGMTVAQRVLSALAARTSSGGREISVSVGVARFPKDGASSDELVGAAQAALRNAKSSGPGAVAAADVG